MNLLCCAAASVLAGVACAQPAALTPAARPLITHDPYFSVWSMTDELTDNWPRHWSGTPMGMSGMVWVDGKAYRWCGPAPQEAPAAERIGGGVTIDKTSYLFTAGGVNLAVEFWSPQSLTGVADDMVQASRSVSVVKFRASCPDKRPHDVRVYLDLSGEWCTNNPDDKVAWSRHRVAACGDVLSLGRVEQPVLQHAGDQRRIDWGRVYLAGTGASDRGGAGGHNASRSRFVQTGGALESDDLRMPRAANDDWPVLAMVVDLKRIEPGDVAEGQVLIGYDEGEAIELFGRKLRPLWNADGKRGFAQELALAAEVCRRDDALLGQAHNQFWTEAARVGGDRYAKL
ncbi:MAG TPA: DUF5127 domain-containing protein, partial [Phycisphaerales bacterium]|nr:DUF5127 domain-containing protein [Phycisphaerales bacterium]